MPRVSIVMLTYNRPQLIGRAIESIVQQDFSDWELLVVQDGENDFTLGLMQEWTRRDGRIQWLRRAQAGNIADATNYALARAQGEFGAILDDDDYWAVPDKLSRQVRFLETHPDYVACGGGVIVIDSECRDQIRYRRPEHDADIRRTALINNPIAHGTGMYRLEQVRAIGLYDVSLEGFQDWDVWLKLGQRGKLYNFPDPFLCYRIWHGSGSFHSSRGNTRSAIRIINRHHRTYRGFIVGLTLAWMYHGYNHLPLALRKWTYSFLMRTKKMLFSGR